MTRAQLRRAVSWVAMALLVAAIVPAAASAAAATAATPQVALGWGANQLGQLGDGTTQNSNTPMAVRGLRGAGALSGITALAVGGDHTLALLSNGTVVAWGANDHGQLGNGTIGGDTNVPAPVVGLGGSGALSGVTAIAANDGYSLALLADGTVMAWGSGGFGQLGNGSTGNTDAPSPVSGVGGAGILTGVSAVAAGQDHSLALLQNGGVVAWGSDSNGQLGNGSAGGTVYAPVPVSGPGGSGALSGVTAIAAGQYHSLAMIANGSVVAWGANADGQLGNGSTTDSSSPVQVSASTGAGALSGATAIAAGQDHSLALLADGTMVSWGSNAYGQLGRGTPFPLPGSASSNDAPGDVTGTSGTPLSGVMAIAAGANHSLALLANGSVLAWGSNGDGQLGNGQSFPFYGPTNPVQVVGPNGYGKLSGVTAIASGSSASESFALQPAPGQVTITSHTLRIDDKRFTLTTPAVDACVPPYENVVLSLAGKALAHGARVSFRQAAIYLGKGIAHRHIRHRHGRTIFTTTYGPNITITKLPATRKLFTNSGSGIQSLTLKVTVTHFVTRHHRRVKRAFTRSLRVEFSVC